MNELLDIKILDYEGPLDLLIHLVYKNEMNIFNISISEITSQFIDEIRKMKEMDIEVAAEFINMASYLVYLKSRMLLPRDSSSEDDIDPEEAKFRFNQLLIEYSFYKDMAQKLKAFEVNSGKFLARTNSIVILREELFTEDTYKLASAFFNISAGKKDKKMVVKNSKIATEQVAKRIKEFILSRDRTLWSEIEETCKEKIEKCVSFGSILELMKGKKIKSFQDGNFKEILLTLIKGAEENDTKIQ